MTRLFRSANSVNAESNSLHIERSLEIERHLSGCETYIVFGRSDQFALSGGACAHMKGRVGGSFIYVHKALFEILDYDLFEFMVYHEAAHALYGADEDEADAFAEERTGITAEDARLRYNQKYLEIVDSISATRWTKFLCYTSFYLEKVVDFFFNR